MHPIERLRYVARATTADAEILVGETAGALAAFADDPPGLVTACRRIVGRHPTSGPMWWLCSRVLTAGDPMREAWTAAEELEEDPTPTQLAHAVPDRATVCVLGWPEQVAQALPRRGDVDVLAVDTGEAQLGFLRHMERAEVDAVDVPITGLGSAVQASDLLLLDASLVGPGDALAAPGSLAAAAVARRFDVPVWLTAGTGRLVPDRIWESVTGRLDAVSDPWDAPAEVVPLDLVTCVVGPAGPVAVAEAIGRTDCPIAPELLKEL